ncbi:MAG: glycogen/starch synthase [Firmicutes bacterium]|nr:glycogen/starch synthase [Bacillota bacterium]MCM1401202.1 glycogen/starch synthase [Bacteroides sp.]MCM1477101.1 glycogen/starch synthase [Bacteroides sp.]
MIENFQDLDLLVETSWEVCNKIGGIYAVLSTKSKTLHELYGDRLVFIGPDVWTDENPSPYFKESKTLLKDWRKTASLPDGVSVRVGRWNVPGKPLAILVKFDGMYAVKDQFYGEMWNRFGVDSLHAYGDYDEACAFSHASGVVIESLYNFMNLRGKRVVAHFDEWTTGMGLLFVKWKLPEVATIFTTHATSIGRSICGNGKPLYDYLSGYNGDQMARELNMESKHSLEKAAAHQADCFTTVSDITARECSQLLERTPDVVTPNGFEDNFVPSGAKFTRARKAARQSLLEVARCLTGKSFDDTAFIVATSGRCEYRNKGIDVFLDSISKLATMEPCREVIAYIMVPAWCDAARTDLQLALAKGEHLALSDPWITHRIHNPFEDPIACRLRSIKLPENVSMIYVPCYLNGTDGIFDLDYYSLLIGMDATVFPSYYEPWGYTPLESVAFGVPTITTSLSGFGQWIDRTFNSDFEECGVEVTERTDSNYEAVVYSIARSLKYLTCCDASVAKLISEKARLTAAEAKWEKFIKYYEEAFAVALANEQKRQNA